MQCEKFLHACGKKWIFFEIILFSENFKIRIKHRIYAFWESRDVRCNKFCMRAIKNLFFLIFTFFWMCQNPGRRELCIFRNLRLSSAGKFCMGVKINEFFIFLFSKTCQNPYETQNFCIFGLSGVGTFCKHATKMNFFFKFYFFPKSVTIPIEHRIYAFLGI